MLHAPLRKFAFSSLAVALVFHSSVAARIHDPQAAGNAAATTPILFVAQVPLVTDFTTVVAVFGNHNTTMGDVPRGGGLMLRMPDGALRDLTAEAGYGQAGMQGANAIAVRDPAMHWSGQKALFSMVIGAPTERYQQMNPVFWQMYEVSGFGLGETAIITKVANQPQNFNNISPAYATNDHIIFTTDRPRNGAAHLYPQRDEYELAPTVSGLWKLNPANGALTLLDHAPSGAFTPIVDSYGRVVFSRWDHLQRDQQADGDTPGGGCGSTSYGTFDYSHEGIDATYSLTNPVRREVFPEPRPCRTDLLNGTNIVGLRFNQFFPWMILEDGTEAETLNHVGRHEFQGYFERSFNDDPNLQDHTFTQGRTHAAINVLQIKESPIQPGTYYAIEAPEFGSHASGQIISFTAPLYANADNMRVADVTHPSTRSYDDVQPPGHTGLQRDVNVLQDGRLIAAHSFTHRQVANEGSPNFPISRYAFRLRTYAGSGPYMQPAITLTNGISRTVTWWSPDEFITHSGNLWELQPVEVAARPLPVLLENTIPKSEKEAFASANVGIPAFRQWMAQRNLALAVTRNVTARDAADRQQPFNLRVDLASGAAASQTLGAAGKVYDVRYLQYFQADQLRGFTGGGTDPRPGRRVLAREMHDPQAVVANERESLIGAVEIAADGSQAAFVPAQRAMTWQLTNAAGTPVVRERYWLTFQPGEVRACTGCHGPNTRDQAARPESIRTPEALVALLTRWKQLQSELPPSKRVFLPVTAR